MTEIFKRICKILDGDGRESSLIVSFFSPVISEEYGGYIARANIKCGFFEKDVYGTGEDEAQAFFWLPSVAVSYLIGKRREGFEAYWAEVGDLDFANFWTYQK
jgi:hypothetical protein